MRHTKLFKSNFTAALVVVAALALSAGGCATVGGPNAKVRYASGPDIQSAREALYNGPKARVAVAKFVTKAAKANAQIGSGMADMLATSLFNTNRYIMLDRQDLDAVINEQDFAESGRVSEKTAAVMGKLEGADLLVMGSVTEFEPEYLGAGGIALGVVSFGASLAVALANDDAPVGAVTYLESHVAIDVKIVDAATGRIVHAGSVEGRYKKWGGGVIGGVGGGASRTAVGLGGFENTGAEEAIRACIDKAVEHIVANTPPEYYRVNEADTMVMANQLVAFYPVQLRDAAPDGPKTREAVTIENEKDYLGLLARLKINPADAPIFDWKNTRLLAVFAGEKATKGHRVSVFKVVDKKDKVEAEVAVTAPAKEPAPEPGADWPFDVVRISKSNKPIKYIWQ